MLRTTKTFVALLTAVLILAALWSRDASAFSVRIHVHFANAIRDDLLKNWDATGKPLIRVKGPDGSKERFVELRLEDAEAIRDFPEFWRAGAIGPDNTVAPGLTDPSHAWMFSPFQQCSALLEASQKPEERAYALGCFLHGITDNNAHHVVNFFTGETFTLYPAEAGENGVLKFSLNNVVRHITVEGKFEAAMEKAHPEEFKADRLKHTIPIKLVRRVYFEDSEENSGLWRSLMGHLIQKKNDALRASNLNGLDPNEHLTMSIEDLKKNKVAVDLDPSVLQAYIDFLTSGGAITGVSPGEMTPADYVLFIPEIVADVKRLLLIAVQHGEKSFDDTVAEWKAEGECSVFCPLLFGRKKLLGHVFDPASNNGQISRAQEALNRKNTELDGIVDGYLKSVEKLSNLNLTKGLANASPIEVATALEPLVGSISKVTDFPYDILFPDAFVEVLDRVAGFKSLLQKTFLLVAQTISEQIVGRLKTYIEEVRTNTAALKEQALAQIGLDIRKLRDKLSQVVDMTKLAAMGLDIQGDGQSLFDNFPTSVLYMNAFNSVAGVLGNQLVVAPHEIAPGFFAGPVSFDASYQLTYNQLTLCDDLAKVFYPCGFTATEMLQPNFASCQHLTGVELPDANIECHRSDAASFLDDPDPESCKRTLLEQLTDPGDGHVGSYTLAFPSDLAEPGPECINPPIVGINATEFGDKADCKGGDCDFDYGNAGCGCSTTSPATAALPLLGLALGMLMMRRRRRR